MISCRRNVLAVLFVASLCGVAHADRADELAARSQKAFAEARYLDAIENLRAAYVYSPRPVFLYSLGQAYRLAHDCKNAVKVYRDFLNAHPSKAQEAAVEQNIARCASEDPSSVATAPVIAPEEVKPALVQPQPAVVTQQPMDVVIDHPVRTSKPAYKKWWVWTLVGVGAVGLGVGLGLGLGLHGSSHFDTTLGEVGPGAKGSTTTASFRF